jgi:hypothetical protein
MNLNTISARPTKAKFGLLLSVSSVSYMLHFKTLLIQEETKAEKWKSRTIGTESKIIGSDLRLIFPGTNDDGSADRLIVVIFPQNTTISLQISSEQERISQNAQDDNLPQHTTQYSTSHLTL